MKNPILFGLMTIIISLFTVTSTQADTIPLEHAQLEHDQIEYYHTMDVDGVAMEVYVDRLCNYPETIDDYLYHLNSQTYIVEFELSQSHFTLDLLEHVKDKMNKITFEIPVDPLFYNTINVNDEIVDKFRVGSFWINGSLGNWKMKVKNKRINFN